MQSEQNSTAYWFRPLRFWGVFALYYPVSRKGFIATAFLVAPLVLLFLFIESQELSLFDTLFQFAPWAIAFGAIFDLLCFRFGEYPSWWYKKTPEKGA